MMIDDCDDEKRMVVEGERWKGLKYTRDRALSKSLLARTAILNEQQLS